MQGLDLTDFEAYERLATAEKRIAELEAEVKLWKDSEATIYNQMSAAEEKLIPLCPPGWKHDWIGDLVEGVKERMDALLADNVAKTEALEKTKCRCTRAINSHCPACGSGLIPVINSGPLSEDQFDAIKAGDWYCNFCEDGSIANGQKHWRDRELEAVVYQQCRRCAALTTPATAEALERVRMEAKAEAVSAMADEIEKVMAESAEEAGVKENSPVKHAVCCCVRFLRIRATELRGRS